MPICHQYPAINAMLTPTETSRDPGAVSLQEELEGGEDAHPSSGAYYTLQSPRRSEQSLSVKA